MSTAPSSWSDSIQAWFDEEKDFKYGSGATTANAVIGHYTQVEAASLYFILKKKIFLCQPTNIYALIIFKGSKYIRDMRVIPIK